MHFACRGVPGHGAGSACGKALGAVPSTTVGYEKVRNWAFQYPKDENGFVKYLLEDQPEPPRYFAMMKKLNKVDRPLLTEVPKIKKLTNAEFKASMDKGIKLIDARMKTEFAQGFIPGSINIQGNNAFATWAGWLVKYDEPFMLIASESQMDDLTRKLMRIGLDNIYGYIESVDVWTELGNTLEKTKLISIGEFDTLAKNNGIQIVDLRGESEYKAGHIAKADHVFVGTLQDNLNKISKDKTTVVYCQSGDRTTIGYSLLVKNGFKNILNYTGGMSEWINKGMPAVSEN